MPTPQTVKKSFSPAPVSPTQVLSAVQAEEQKRYALANEVIRNYLRDSTAQAILKDKVAVDRETFLRGK